MSLDVLNLLAVLAAALAGGAVARRFGYPSVLGELGAGILLGPPLLGLLEADPGLGVLGKLGVLVMMLAIGMHLEPGDLRNASGPGLLAAAGGFVVPFGLGLGVALLFGEPMLAAIFIGLAMGVTSLATKSRILVDLDLLGTRIAHVLMVGALIADVTVLVAFAAVLGAAAAGALLLTDLAIVGLEVVLFLAGSFVVGSFVLPRFGGLISRLDRTTRLLTVAGIGLLFAAGAELAGVHAILGAFVGGLFIREGVLERDAFRQTESDTNAAALGLLAPIFFVTAGFDVSLDVFQTDLALLVLVVVLATIGKIAGTALFYVASGHGWREGVVIGMGMNGRGAVEIVVAELALQQGLISQEVFSILVFMAIFTTATVPILLTRGVDWLRRRGDLGEAGADRTGIVIGGAGPLARAVARELAPGRDVVLVDTNADHVDAAERDGLRAIRGNVLDESDLAEAGGYQAGYFLGLTPNLEVNVLAAQVADRAVGVPRRIVAVPEHTTEAIETLLVSADADTWLDRPIAIEAWDADLTLGRARVVSIEVDDPEDLPLVGSGPIDTGLETLAVAVVRDDRAWPYDAVRSLRTGDRVIALTRPTTQADPQTETAAERM
jgi:Kef-type K+ transport system membrane component KefB/Trk K+ transport system NAD-binding subunit